MVKLTSKKALIETLAEIEHDQWIEWSKAVSKEVSEERRKRWEKLWIPYNELSEEMKDQDRKYAQKVIKAFEKQNTE